MVKRCRPPLPSLNMEMACVMLPSAMDAASMGRLGKWPAACGTLSSYYSCSAEACSQGMQAGPPPGMPL